MTLDRPDRLRFTAQGQEKAHKQVIELVMKNQTQIAPL
jgi:hypothetical protein